ncbi:MAG: cytochrome c family protein [Pseudomonadota bacterium]
MDPLGNNKIFAAILGAALVFMMIRMLPEMLMHNEAPKVPAYIVGELETSEVEEEIELPFPQAEWVAAMDAERGARVFRNCTSCHTLEDGGANGTGPGLWNVVGAEKGVVPGFAYSEAMGSTGTVWGYEELDGFLEKPKSWLPGTKMNFVGIRKESDRAAVIEYLRLASNNPLPQPEVAPALVELTAEAEVVTEDPAAEATDAVSDVMDTVEEAASDVEETVTEAVEDVPTENEE